MADLRRHEQLVEDRGAAIPELASAIERGVTVKRLVEFTEQVLVRLDGSDSSGNRKGTGSVDHDRDQPALVDALLRMDEVKIVDRLQQIVQGALFVLTGHAAHQLVAATRV